MKKLKKLGKLRLLVALSLMAILIFGVSQASIATSYLDEPPSNLAEGASPQYGLALPPYGSTQSFGMDGDMNGGQPPSFKPRRFGMSPQFRRRRPRLLGSLMRLVVKGRLLVKGPNGKLVWLRLDSGKISYISDEKLTITEPGGKQIEINLNSNTKVIIGRQRASLDDLEAGMKVKVVQVRKRGSHSYHAILVHVAPSRGLSLGRGSDFLGDRQPPQLNSF